VRVSQVLIVGQGLGGTLLGWQLEQAGIPFKVVQSYPRRTASLVSAGMVDPISGQRFALAHRAADTIPLARRWYQALEAELNMPLISDYPIWRLFRHIQDYEYYQKKKGGLGAYIEQELTDVSPYLASERGGILVKGFQVNVSPIIRHFESKWTQSSTLIRGYCHRRDIRIHGHGIEWNGLEADLCMDCGGFESEKGYFDWLPYRLSRGEVLIGESDRVLPERVVNNGHWFRPMGAYSFQFGASYAWDSLTRIEAGHVHLLQDALTALWPYPHRIVRIDSGVRQMVADAKPVIGLHPSISSMGIMGGVGSKGTQWYPYLVNEWMNTIRYGFQLPEDCNVVRFKGATP